MSAGSPGRRRRPIRWATASSASATGARCRRRWRRSGSTSPREETTMADQPQYDVVIVGAGIAGSIIASELAAAGKRVLILEAGPGVPDNRSQYMDNFYLSNAKTPESPYPPLGLQPG